MKKLLPLCLLLASVALAQDGGKISGTVRDRSTKEVLPGVNVTVRGTKLGGATNAAGAYFILNVTPGVYEVTATLVGYQTVTQRQVEVNVNRTTALNFTLSETGVELGQEVVITAERPDVAREKTSTSEIVRAEEVLLTPGMRDLTDVLTLSSDVVDGHFRGGRENEELYVLAGMGIVNPLYGASAFVPIMSAVEEVEVITSGFGAQYGNAQSGVVNISMKEGKNDRWRGRAEVRGESRAQSTSAQASTMRRPIHTCSCSILLKSGLAWMSPPREARGTTARSETGLITSLAATA